MGGRVYIMKWCCEGKNKKADTQYDGKQTLRGDFLIFSSNKSFLLRKRMIDVSVNQRLLQIESNSFRLSCIRFYHNQSELSITTKLSCIRFYDTQPIRVRLSCIRFYHNQSEALMHSILSHTANQSEAFMHSILSHTANQSEAFMHSILSHTA